MKGADAVRIVCATCEGNWPTIAKVVSTPTGLRFRSRFTEKVIATTHAIDTETGECKSTPGRLLHKFQVIDVAVDDENAAFRCGCPNGDGVVTIERHVMLEQIAEFRRTGRTQQIELHITPTSTIYKIG